MSQDYKSEFMTQILSRKSDTLYGGAREHKIQWNFPWKFPFRNQYINDSSDSNQSF